MIQSHFTPEDYFLSALEMANISIPLTPKPMKMTEDDQWVQRGHHSCGCRQEYLPTATIRRPHWANDA